MKLQGRREIEEQAKSVLLQHGLYSVPVDPVVLANKLGIKVNNAVFSDEGIAGLTAKRDKEILLLVNQNDPPYRKRFTIAHELAHHFLHIFEGEQQDITHKKIDLFRLSETDMEGLSEEKIKEIEANRFAASLLMPEELVRVFWRKYPSIETMARLFNVSEEAMGYRVGNLGLDQ